MTKIYNLTHLKKTGLAVVIGLSLSQPSLALEALSDESLAETTGAGIAFLPQDAYFVYRGAGENESKAALFNDRSKDTGYYHFNPVGPLTATALDTNKDGAVNGNDHSVGKADLFLYGLALSRSDSDHRNRIATTEAEAMIRNWGTPDNPWVIKVATETNVPHFGSSACAGETDSSCQVSYFGLEAPLYDRGDVGIGADAYALKMAFWADAFVLDQNQTPDSTSLYHLGERMGQTDANRANRFRFQAIMDGFSINGSRLQLFQTLGGASNNGGMSVFYNDTLGMAALIRLNSGDSSSVNTGDYSGRFLRLSTRETGTTAHLDSPAIAGSGAPTFSPNDGIFIENLNANLVLGSLSQPMLISSDGKNFSLEIARIPNKVDIYKKIYIDYDNARPSGVTFEGSICNVYQCGRNDSKAYQGNNATHSSISIGSTLYDSDKNSLTANPLVNSRGISFGAPNLVGGGNNPNSTQLGSGVIDGVLIQHLKVTTKGL